MTIQRTVTHAAAVLLLTLAWSGAACADNTAARTPATSGSSASATVGFRIVIRETLRLGDQTQRVAANAPQTTRTVDVVNDRQMITLARP